MNIIEVKGLIRCYEKGAINDMGNKEDVKVLRGIDLDIIEHDFICIMGKSGCGKTTLLKTLGLIDKPNQGTIQFKGRDTTDLYGDALSDIRRNEIGFVFQDFYLMDSLSVLENIMLPMILNQEQTNKMVRTAKELAEHYEISHLLNKNPYQLSGGEKQRVAICRALGNNPDVIMADEPTGNLDSKSAKIVIDSLKRVNEDLGKTVIIVTHDPLIASASKKIVFLKDGIVLDIFEKEKEKENFYDVIVKKMIDL
ncbi:ABC transporter ATP-binding protein [Lachnospiraceae bacterium LCP25S3_G4]